MKGWVACLLLGCVAHGPVWGQSTPDGWAPFDCAGSTEGSQYGDGQRERELALVPHPNPETTEEFFANLRDFELRQTLAPDWQWLRHMPLLRDRFLDSLYGSDVRDYFRGDLRAERLDVAEWRQFRCNSKFDDRSYVLFRLVETASASERARVVFHRDGIWGMMGHASPRNEDPAVLRQRFVATVRTASGREPENVQWAFFASSLCGSLTYPCVVGRVGDEVLVGGPALRGVFLFDPHAPFLEERERSNGSPVAAIGDRRFRRLVPWSGAGDNHPPSP
jgi:hypothetical protein